MIEVHVHVAHWVVMPTTLFGMTRARGGVEHRAASPPVPKKGELGVNLRPLGGLRNVKSAPRARFTLTLRPIATISQRNTNGERCLLWLPPFSLAFILRRPTVGHFLQHPLP